MSHVKYLLLYVTSDHVDYKCTLIFTVHLSQNGATALHLACLGGHNQVVELLLQARASVDQKAKVRWESVKLCIILNSTLTIMSWHCILSPTFVHFFIKSWEGVFTSIP